jgi:hypothetical protein
MEVHIPPLQLMFFVNPNNTLFSPQLKLEIDPNQDAGTWYGLMQKLVCRNPNNPLRRTVLVPLGGLEVKRWGCHVIVNIRYDGRYAKFTINDTIGRIECAVEPWLVYTKALLHSYTSFLLPDPLTGRTGTEESLHFLQSGICRPWNPLGNEEEVLHWIANLTPVREYYPSGLRVMKTDRWDDRLTCHIQHPLYRQVVEAILKHSKELQTFAVTTNRNEIDSYGYSAFGDSHLTARALLRRQLYERRVDGEIDNLAYDGGDRLYQPRDRSVPSDKLYSKVQEITHLLRTKPDSFKTPRNLAAILSQGNVIGGYGSEYDKVSLSDRIHTDLREHWGSLVECCRNQQSCFDLMFLFATLSYRENADIHLLRALVAFAVLPELQFLPLLPWPSYFNFRPESKPELGDIVRLIQPFKTPPPCVDGEDLGQYMNAKQRRKIFQAREAHLRKSEQGCRSLAESLLLQWPCSEPNVSDLASSDLLIDFDEAMEAVRPIWLNLYQNKELSDHLSLVQDIFHHHHSNLDFALPAKVTNREPWLPVQSGPPRLSPVPSLCCDLLPRQFNLELRSSLASKYPVPERALHVNLPFVNNRVFSPMTSSPAGHVQPQALPQKTGNYVEELRQIVRDLANSKSLVRKRYAQDLARSLEAFENRRAPDQLAKPFLSLRDHTSSLLGVSNAFESLRTSLEQETPDMSADQIKWLQIGGLWPAITRVTLLEQLRSTANHHFGSGMREAIISFGLAITKLQREMRLNECVIASDISRFQDEEANIGHTNWDPEEYLDWLLLEIESNLLIRPGQVDVARAIMSPASGANSVLQMNMGQGKTSCIIPMVAASMADKKRLVRIIVPKPLLLQTAQLLQSRLGGMLDRCVGHIPFSRRTNTNEDAIRLYRELHKNMLKAAGVMICLPEHNLSFMLSGQQRILDDRIVEARQMIKVHSWLRSVCRDVLDESDYTLAARTQLIYPSGTQMSVDGSPHRWLVIQAILGLVDVFLYDLSTSFPRSIEVVRRKSGGFPFIYFLRRDVEDALLRRLEVAVSNGHADILPIRSLNGKERSAVREFISPSTRKLKPNTMETIWNLCPDRPHVRQTAYLLRGLLVNRILIMVLKKRWNVQYGLRPNSDPIAVPYHAKGVPSEQSEWGHPDVAILFTCLVFYYDGISESQLRQALARVLKSDDPSTEYDKWVHSSSEFPPFLRAWNTISIEDATQVREIWKAVRYQVVVIDYFLNNFVFPQHAKQFKVKLQSSGWDIPLFSAQSDGAEERAVKKGLRPLTTGFSGTNDNRALLPLTIQQADLPTLAHTNAEVLTYLLHDRSRKCEIITGMWGGRASERELLMMLKKKNIKILIDAGAQILEMDNETLAKTWLEIDQEGEAALYFDSVNKPWIISKKNRKTPFLASPYADDLSNCLVYLDEVSLQ